MNLHTTLLLGWLCSTSIAVAQPADLRRQPLIHTPPAQPEITLVNGFAPHAAFAGTGYVIEPLHPVHSPMDYRAWHDESFSQLTVLYYRAWGWPRQEMTEEQNRRDLQSNHYSHFLRQDDFAYTVMTPDGSRVIGSLYIYPGTCGSYDVAVQYWINTPDRAAVETVFHAETKSWIEKNWPYKSVFYPGPDLSDVERGRKNYEIARYVCRP